MIAFICVALIIAAAPGFWGWHYTSKKLVDPAVDSMLTEQSGLVVRSLGVPLTSGNMKLFEQQLKMSAGDIIQSVELIDAEDGTIHYNNDGKVVNPTTGVDKQVLKMAATKTVHHVNISGDIHEEYVGIPIVSSCLRCHDGTVAKDHHGKVGSIAAYFKISSDYSIVNQISHSQATYFMLATIAILATIILVVFFIRFTLVRPTRQLQNRLAEIVSGEGDLTQRLPVNKSELGEISSYLNQLMQKISDILTPIKELANDLHSTSGNLSQNAEQSEHIIDSLTQAAEGNAHAATQLSNSVSSVADTNNHVASQTQEARQMATDGLDKVNQVVEEMDSICEHTESFTRKMVELEGSSEEIGKILKTIDEIAFQTNLLALNAAVEAARAGSSGKGFAVVAEEVRNLAARSAKAAEEIAAMIESVQGDTNEAMKQSTGNAERLRSGANEVQQIGTSMEEIVQAIVGVADKIDGVASTTEEQSASSIEVAGHADSVKSSAMQLRTTSGAVAGSASEIDERIQRLEQLLGQFKT